MKKHEIDYQQVTYLEAEQNYTRIFFLCCKNIIIPRTLMRFDTIQYLCSPLQQ
jgi:hypothetical protein